jgi:hypothetical protein
VLRLIQFIWETILIFWYLFVMEEIPEEREPQSLEPLTVRMNEIPGPDDI